MANPEPPGPRAAYGARADEYIAALGNIDAMAPADRDLISGWARGINGRIIDAGCGPGHWTNYLREQGADVIGVDTVPEFISSARHRFPHTKFHLGLIESLPVESASLAGVLAWYSVIHHEPDRILAVFHEFARCLEPGGSLLLGLFAGPAAEPFEHAVIRAYFWSGEAMTGLLNEAGFTVTEIHARTEQGHRPHLDVLAVRH